MKRDFGIFLVGLKVLLRRKGEVLILRDADNGHFDLPGGRIDNVEYEVPLERVISREIREELGRGVKYKLGRPLFQFRRWSRASKKYVFLTVYDAEYLAGDIRISDEHSEYFWISSKRAVSMIKGFRNTEERSAMLRHFRSKKL